MQQGLADMEEARGCKATDEHNVIDDAIQDRGEGYTVFSIVSNVFPAIQHVVLTYRSTSSQWEFCIVPQTRSSRTR